jgi:hypothetical protein
MLSLFLALHTDVKGLGLLRRKKLFPNTINIVAITIPVTRIIKTPL